jgi:hypothetical protein
MVRIVLITGCLASPKGIFFRGYETEVAEEEATVLIATGQWQRVGPPPVVSSLPAKTVKDVSADSPPKKEFRRKR